MKFNLLDNILPAMQKHLSALAVIDDTGQYTYSQLLERMDLYQANWFKDRAPGTRVTVNLPDGIDWVAVALAAVRSGMVLTIINHRFTQEQTQAMYQQLDSQLLINRDLVALVDTSLSCNLVVDTDENDHAIYYNSSGTSAGRSRTIIHTHKSFWNVCDQVAYYNVRPGYVYQMGLPLTSSWGLFICFSTLIRGATLALTASMQTPQHVKELANRSQSDNFYTGTGMLSLLIRTENTIPWENVYVGGEIVSPRLLETWRSITGTTPQVVFGAGETGQVFMPSAKQALKGSLGLPLPTHQIEIRDYHGNVLTKPGDSGIAWFKSTCNCSGYYQNNALTKSSMNNDWFTAGDLFTIGNNNDYLFAGRTNDRFKVEGKDVDPVTVEKIIIGSNLVDEVAVLPSLDQNGIVQVKALVVTRSKVPELKKQIYAYTRSHLLKHECPKMIEIVEDLPRTPAGKILRKMQ